MKYGVRDNVITYYDDDGNLLPFTPYGKPQKKPDPPIKTMLTPEEKAQLYGDAKRVIEWKIRPDIKPEPLKTRMKIWAITGIICAAVLCISAVAGYQIADIIIETM